MITLALEFSSRCRSAALLKLPGAGGAAALQRLGRAEEEGERTGKPFALIEQALQRSGLERGQVECIVAGLGPGSYTGIRSAIAITQGWQLARGVKLLGVSSADALVAQARRTGLTGVVHVVIDAQRGEFYAASYQLEENRTECLRPLRLMTREGVLDLASAGGVILGPDAARCFSEARDVFPQAETLGELALGRTDFVPGEQLEPIYLRETQFVKAPPPRVSGDHSCQLPK